MDKLDDALGAPRETPPRKRVRDDNSNHHSNGVHSSRSKSAPDGPDSVSSVSAPPLPLARAASTMSTGASCTRITNNEPCERIQDPFTCSLRCRTVPDSRHHRVLWWHSPVPPIPFHVEADLIPLLVPYQKRERGMFKDQPTHRIRKLERLCASKRVSMASVLSLRRHHMKRWNPNLGMHQLRLGSDDDIRESARLFEETIRDVLRRSNVAFYSESDQKEHIRKHRQPGQPYPPTPDFILREPIRIKTYVTVVGPGGRDNKRVIQERSVCCTYFRLIFCHDDVGPCRISLLTDTTHYYCLTVLQGLKSKCSTVLQRLNTTAKAQSVVCGIRPKSTSRSTAKEP